MDANPAACSYYGYSREEFKPKKSPTSIRSPRSRYSPRCGGPGRDSRSTFTFAIAWPAAKCETWKFLAVSIRLQGQDLLYSIIHDITERKQAERGPAPKLPAPGPAGGDRRPTVGQRLAAGRGGRHLSQGHGISRLRGVFQFPPWMNRQDASISTPMPASRRRRPAGSNGWITGWPYAAAPPGRAAGS